MHILGEALARPPAPLGDEALPLTHDVACLRLLFVNVYLIGAAGAGDRAWVLVDAGLPGTAALIARAAEGRFGTGARPAAIVLTHGHFDHVGALPELAERWDVPVYAHALEMPYLTGRSPYPPPDPTVGGGAMSWLSPLYPRGPIDLAGRARALPGDGTLPDLPEWRAVPTPGHSPGHIALFRAADRLLLAGDALVTTKQESALAALAQTPEVHGPPAYFTPDWEAARRSVEVLADLDPAVVATGHGRPLRGEEMRGALAALAAAFDRVAVPRRGRYVARPAVTDEGGIVSIPPAAPGWPPRGPLVLGAALLLALAVSRRRGRALPGGMRHA